MNDFTLLKFSIWKVSYSLILIELFHELDELLILVIRIRKTPIGWDSFILDLNLFLGP